MNEQQRKQLENEFRNDKLKKILIVSMGIIGFIAIAIFILYGKLS